MKLVILIGNGAVGKMTVGQELTKITDLRLFHNHMSIEPVLEVFGEFNTNVIKQIRDIYFKEFVKTNNFGLIFTYMWAFDMQEDWDYIEHVKYIFKDADIYYVELIADSKVRLERNTTENRLKHKASKRDIIASEQRNNAANNKHRLVSNNGEITFENYIKIDNTHLEANEVASIIKKHFNL